MFKLIEKKDENTGKGGQVKKLTMVSLEYKNLAWNNWSFQKEKLKNVMDINKKLENSYQMFQLKCVNINKPRVKKLQMLYQINAVKTSFHCAK